MPKGGKSDEERRKIFRSGGLSQKPAGCFRFGLSFFLVVLGAVGYAGVKIGTVYWEYFEVRQKIREALNWAAAGQAKSDAEIFQKVSANVREAGLELKPRDVKITHTSEDLTITVSWKREVDFPSYPLPLNFSVNLTEIKRWTRGGLIVK